MVHTYWLMVDYERVVAPKHWCYPTMVRDAWVDGLRADAWFEDLFTRVEGGFRQAIAAFVAGDGEQILSARPEQ